MEDFVTFEIAKKLKEKRFKEKVIKYYGKHQNMFDCHPPLDMNDADYRCSAPTIAQVLKWLRNEKEIYCLPHFEQGIDMWLFCIERPLAGTEFAEYISESIYNTYEDAAIAGIEYVLDYLI